MAHHQVALLQEVAGHVDAFVQQAAGIVAQIENQALDVVLAQLASACLPFPCWCSR